VAAEIYVESEVLLYVDITAKEIFPGLDSQLPDSRFKRVSNAIDSLLHKSLTRRQNGSPFIITGDIPAMWLRDSTWQVAPLLYSRHPDVIKLLIELSKTQVELFLIDPYANAFNPEPNGACWHKDFPNQSPWVFERKFELDSWASVLYLARMIVEKYNRFDHIDSSFEEALTTMLNLAKREQRHDPDSYVFKRDNGVLHDSLSHEGYGAPVAYTGMVYSAFRPSDDACVYGYLVPSNLFFLNELERLPEKLKSPASLRLAVEIREGLESFAVIDGRYAYEVDGLGNSLCIDDANIPSLLSLPHLGCVPADDARYRSTREFILSFKNPYYFSGIKASGIGSQHTPSGFVWPIALAVQALTDPSVNNKLDTLDLLEVTDAETGNMHEAFDVNDDKDFTRSWFSWADMTYVQLVLDSVNYQSR
jgi:meiotically up-regulated gene 157 (Mug157) protein